MWPSVCGSEMKVCLIFNPLLTFLSHFFHFGWSLLNIWRAVSNQAAHVESVCLVICYSPQVLGWKFLVALLMCKTSNEYVVKEFISELNELKLLSLSLSVLALSVTLECNQLRALGEPELPWQLVDPPMKFGRNSHSTVPKGIPIGWGSGSSYLNLYKQDLCSSYKFCKNYLNCFINNHQNRRNIYHHHPHTTINGEWKK